jgi:hypothetical protein
VNSWRRNSRACKYNRIILLCSSTGNAQDFGDLFSQEDLELLQHYLIKQVVYLLEELTPAVNIIEYITISINRSKYTRLWRFICKYKLWFGRGSSSTRGVFGGGSGAPTTQCQLIITISTLGNSSDFGDLFSVHISQ